MNDQERAKRALWQSMFNEKSLALLRAMRDMQFGEITVTVHNGLPQKIQKPYQSIILKPLTPDEVGDESVD